MNTIKPEDFNAFFAELHDNREPYSWQTRLAARAIDSKWPKAIDLPTGAGKTACIDIAIFALACAASQSLDELPPRRIFFCVNRRVIVDEAHQRAQAIARQIWEAEKGGNDKPTLRNVAAALRTLTGLTPDSDTPPLDVLELRGGIYRDNRWARSLTQPTVVCTTIDQLGSRLLFRGYGVSPNAAPVQAAMIAYDSLILLDEAHISRPFEDTLDAVCQYIGKHKDKHDKRWAEQRLPVERCIFVPMTATPSEDLDEDDILSLDDEDHAMLERRLSASKPAELRECKDVAKDAVDAANGFAKVGPVAVGIIVNRVATAKGIYQKLKTEHGDNVHLVIGSMRPLDRDAQATAFREIVGTRRPPVSTRTSFVIATQCLEVGADYDFDVLITECASLDALQQRFGRLNRAGRDIEARAVILAAKKDAKPEDKLTEEKPADPIYGNALAHTWNWLNTTATNGAVDFGIDAFISHKNEHIKSEDQRNALLSPSASKRAPVMLPAYVDLWCQTSPAPSLEPDVSLFIHGQQEAARDVQVCWRADLVVEENKLTNDDWPDVIALLPPTAAECMTVPMKRLADWLTESSDDDGDHGDVLGIPDDNSDDNANAARRRTRVHAERIGIAWRGSENSDVVKSIRQLKPGDTLVLPVSAAGWDALGHIPTAAPDSIDIAEQAFHQARDRAALRLHPSLFNEDERGLSPLKELLKRLVDSNEVTSDEEVQAIVRNIAAGSFDTSLTVVEACRLLADVDERLQRETYPDERGVVFTTRNRLHRATDWFLRLPTIDDGEDDRSRTTRSDAITLTAHTQHVRCWAERIINLLPLKNYADAILTAADWHDLGKADVRFQATLRRTDRTSVSMHRNLIAKSDCKPQTARDRARARDRADLPKGFRHEMLSMQLAERSELTDHSGLRELILHLIASHHGCARPFAPVVIDEELPGVEVDGIVLTHSDRAALCPPHRLDSGIGERFWNLTHRHGWWGLAYLEAVVRLADQQASAEENNESSKTEECDRLAGVIS